MQGYHLEIEADVEAENINERKAEEMAQQFEVVLGDWFGFEVEKVAVRWQGLGSP